MIFSQPHEPNYQSVAHLTSENKIDFDIKDAKIFSSIIDRCVIRGIPGGMKQLANFASLDESGEAEITLGVTPATAQVWEKIAPCMFNLSVNDARKATFKATSMGLRSQDKSPSGNGSDKDDGRVVDDGDESSFSADGPDASRDGFDIVIMSIGQLGGVCMPHRFKLDLLRLVLGKNEVVAVGGVTSDRILLAGGLTRPVKLKFICDAFDELDLWQHLGLFQVGPVATLPFLDVEMVSSSENIWERSGKAIDYVKLGKIPFFKGLSLSLQGGFQPYPILLDHRVTLLTPAGLILVNRPGPKFTGSTPNYYCARTFPCFRTWQAYAVLAALKESGLDLNEALVKEKMVPFYGKSTVYYTQLKGKVGKSAGVEICSIVEQKRRYEERTLGQKDAKLPLSRIDVVSQLALSYYHNYKKCLLAVFPSGSRSVLEGTHQDLVMERIRRFEEQLPLYLKQQHQPESTDPTSTESNLLRMSIEIAYAINVRPGPYDLESVIGFITGEVDQHLSQFSFVGLPFESWKEMRGLVGDYVGVRRNWKNADSTNKELDKTSKELLVCYLETNALTSPHGPETGLFARSPFLVGTCQPAWMTGTMLNDVFASYEVCSFFFFF